ncbi:MAG TPA: hypothetical protein DCF49_00010 [Lachnospiraceae bacterium]|nr:hypothetical protein [Lachnospiraceae bacterium]
MSIRFVVNKDKYGDLCIYEGDTVTGGTIRYVIQQGTNHGGDSFYIRKYPSKEIAFTVIPDKTYKGNYRVYEGSDIMYGAAVPYYVDTTSTYITVRKGDSISGDRLYTVRPGSACDYVVEDQESYGVSGSGSSTNDSLDVKIIALAPIFLAVALFLWVGIKYNPGIFVLPLAYLVFKITSSIAKNRRNNRRKK